MSKSIVFHELSELGAVASQVINFAGDSKIWLFEGPMGAGKTTLIKEIAKQFGVTGNVASPTYSLVNEYLTNNNSLVYHFDFYRLKTETEALDYGIDEYFESGNLCLCEWPSKIAGLLPDEFIMVNLQVQADGSRKLVLEKIPNS